MRKVSPRADTGILSPRVIRASVSCGMTKEDKIVTIVFLLTKTQNLILRVGDASRNLRKYCWLDTLWLSLLA